MVLEASTCVWIMLAGLKNCDFDMTITSDMALFAVSPLTSYTFVTTCELLLHVNINQVCKRRHVAAKYT